MELSTPAPEIQRVVQAARDQDHLRLLEIGFFISGILTGLRFVWLLFIGAFFMIGGFAAAQAAAAKIPTHDGPPPAIVMVIIAALLGIMIFLTLLFAALEIYAGFCLKNRRHPVLIQIVAALYCLSIPWGTALGVMTFMVLNRPSVRVLFSQR
jgi:hypothetical protein